MITFERGQYLKPKKPNRFWVAFEILQKLRQDTATTYDVMCYGHTFVESIEPLEREIVMCHHGLEESAELITEESFKNIVMEKN